jgi:hypothetical protein
MIRALVYKHLCGRTDILLLDSKDRIPPAIKDTCHDAKEECNPGAVVEGKSFVICQAPKVQEIKADEILQILQAELRRREGVSGNFEITTVAVAGEGPKGLLGVGSTFGTGGQKHG